MKTLDGKPPPAMKSHASNKHTPNIKVLIATGAADPLVPRDMVARFEDEVANVPGLELTVASYKGTTHAFTTFMPRGQANATLSFNPHAARQSWVSAIDLFREVLEVPGGSAGGPSSRMWVNDGSFDKWAKQQLAKL